MNLIHSYDGVKMLGSGLLHPSMPLTTFRAFFCEWVCNMIFFLLFTKILKYFSVKRCFRERLFMYNNIFQLNIPALMTIANWYSESLEKLEIIDALDHYGWRMLSEMRDQGIPDPLVMLTWKCTKLTHLTLIGKSSVIFHMKLKTFFAESSN